MTSGRIPYSERRVFRLEEGSQIDLKTGHKQPAWLVVVYRNRKLMKSAFLCWRTPAVNAAIERQQLLLETIMTRFGNSQNDPEAWEFSFERMCGELMRAIKDDLPGTALSAFEQFEAKKARLERQRRAAQAELAAEREWKAKRLGRGKRRRAIGIYKDIG